MASSYREGCEWSCECHYCRLLAGVRNYLAHHWARGPVRLRDIGRPVERGRDGGPAGQRRRRQRPAQLRAARRHRARQQAAQGARKFDAAARALGKGAGRFNVAPAVEGCLRCLSANHAGWRSENPLPELADHPHGGPGADLLELARQRRQASVGRAPGSLGPAGGTWT